VFSFQTKLSMLRAVLTKDAPFYIQYYIDSRCNLMCRQCNIVEANADAPEADLDGVRRIADNLRAVGAGVVLLTGGEPFLRPDLPDMVRVFRERGLDVRLQTNGMRMATPERLKACVDAGARDINVSLDSLYPDKQDYINSVPGSWEPALRTVADISRIFPTKGSICSFGCVLSRYNFREIPHLLEFATRIGWHLSLVPVHITRPDLPMGFRSYDARFNFRPEDLPALDAVFERLYAMKREGFLLFDSFTFLRSAQNFIRTGTPTWRKDGVCDSPHLYFAVRPNGDFAVCCDHRLKGERVSLLDPDFPEVFRSRAFRERVAAQTGPCGGCHYGSYPEMTISVRDPQALWERFLLNFKAERKSIRPVSADELLALARGIREAHPEVYDLRAHPEEGNNPVILRWEDPKGRAELMKEYAEERLREGRVRAP
jgi:MoaA/NifB/PqqE/SkfB family radical SAM enzyme